MHDLPEPDWYLDHVVVPAGVERSAVGPIRAWQGSWAALAHRLGEQAGESPMADAERLALTQGFVLTRAHALGLGLTDADLRRLVRRAEWIRCGRGCLATVPSLATGESRDAARRRNALAAAAAALRRRGHTVGGASAAVLHGLPLLDLPPRPQLIAASSRSA